MLCSRLELWPMGQKNEKMLHKIERRYLSNIKIKSTMGGITPTGWKFMEPLLLCYPLTHVACWVPCSFSFLFSSLKNYFWYLYLFLNCFHVHISKEKTSLNVNLYVSNNAIWMEKSHTLQSGKLNCNSSCCQYSQADDHVSLGEKL